MSQVFNIVSLFQKLTIVLCFKEFVYSFDTYSCITSIGYTIL